MVSFDGECVYGDLQCLRNKTNMPEEKQIPISSNFFIPCTGLENSTRPLVFTSISGCRASEYFDIPTENQIFPMYANKFCDAGQVPIFRYFEACV